VVADFRCPRKRELLAIGVEHGGGDGKVVLSGFLARHTHSTWERCSTTLA
jgi:hypothetical protein